MNSCIYGISKKQNFLVNNQGRLVYVFKIKNCCLKIFIKIRVGKKV